MERGNTEETVFPDERDKSISRSNNTRHHNQGDPNNVKSNKEQEVDKKKIRRGKKCKNALKRCKIMCCNIRGYKTKVTSIKEIIEEQKPVIIGLVETKLREQDQIEIEGYEIKRKERAGEGGGVLIAYRKSLKIYNNRGSGRRKELRDALDKDE